MDGKTVVDSMIREIVQPGVQRLMESRYFSELREGKLSIRRQGSSVSIRINSEYRLLNGSHSSDRDRVSDGESR